jgi:hypothetical protein
MYSKSPFSPHICQKHFTNHDINSRIFLKHLCAFQLDTLNVEAAQGEAASNVLEDEVEAVKR